MLSYGVDVEALDEYAYAVSLPRWFALNYGMILQLYINITRKIASVWCDQHLIKKK